MNPSNVDDHPASLAVPGDVGHVTANSLVIIGRRPETLTAGPVLDPPPALMLGHAEHWITRHQPRADGRGLRSADHARVPCGRCLPIWLDLVAGDRKREVP